MSQLIGKASTMPTRNEDIRALQVIMHYHGAMGFLDILKAAYLSASDEMETVIRDKKAAEVYWDLYAEIELED